MFRKIFFSALVMLIVGIGAIAYIHISQPLQPDILTGQEEEEPGSSNEALLPSHIKDIIDKNREKENINDEDVKDAYRKFLYDYKSNADEPDFPPVSNGTTAKELISRQNAVEDINYLFDSLKYSYAGYQYFGGDEAFLNAREKILLEISKHNQNLHISELADSVIRNLSFIQDAHFRIGSQGTYKNYYYLDSDQYVLYKDDNGFFTTFNDERFYVIEAGDSRYEDFIKPTITKNGEAAYTFGMIDHNTECRIEVCFSNGSRQFEKTVDLSYKPPRDFDKTGYRKYFKSGIPILVNRRMAPKSDKSDELDAFVNDAVSFNNYRISVIDIRGNSGGYSIYPMEWYKNVTGRQPSAAKIICELNTILTLQHKLAFCEKNIIADKESKISELNDAVLKIRTGEAKEGWNEIYLSKEEKYPSRSVVIVLLDKNIASSGEEFVQYLRSFENIIFIGTNTMGAQLIGSNSDWLLPNSGMEVFCGTSLVLPPSLKNIDGLGYQPDFWISAEDILDRTIKFIIKNKLR